MGMATGGSAVICRRNTWLLLVLALLVGACSHALPEQALRATMASLQAAVQARQPSVIKSILAEDFIGPDGMDRTGATRLAQGMFLQHRDVGATLGTLEITLLPLPSAPDHATVRFTTMLTGGSGEILPDSAREYDVETGWRLEGHAWRLTSATWTPRL